jgi:hypothetical protein
VVKQTHGGVFMALVDVLGHGRKAAEVALAAIRILKQVASPEVGPVLVGLDQALHGTLGAAAVIAFADESGAVRFTGVGNVVIRRAGLSDQAFTLPDGIVGVRPRTPRVTHINLAPSELLLLYSDGVPQRFPIPPDSQLFGLSTANLARRVVLDHGRYYDDAACVALRYSK